MTALEDRAAETAKLSDADRFARDHLEETANVAGALADALRAEDAATTAGKCRVELLAGRLRGRVSALAGIFGLSLEVMADAADKWLGYSGAAGWCAPGVTCARIRELLRASEPIRDELASMRRRWAQGE